ncbi:hypothetical protein MHO82_21210 [Vibrio sp. Of7-15]|uniref:hypothetical protein n=1 Tax=Vibrio sp. Of7-15 TaxID=2724879 RepID=UPI001EF39B3B|nr:hypothetical protein [Vibrio sp. Of7-15]MCG7499389.1 hypothetical protein [Vibrio sp. Of7-15]
MSLHHTLVNIQIKTEQGTSWVKRNEKGLNKGFVASEDKRDATKFYLISHDSIEDAYYFKIFDDNLYLDQGTRSGLCFQNRPKADIHKSTIWAWKIEDQYMCAVATADKRGLQKIATKDRQLNGILMCNFSEKDAVTVRWETTTP